MNLAGFLSCMILVRFRNERSRIPLVHPLFNSKSERQLPADVPPSPCNRICRYNAKVYDGQVCIGCFRETYEIANWSSMSPIEKSYALMDAADRSDGSAEMDGALRSDELTRQAEAWSRLQ